MLRYVRRWVKLIPLRSTKISSWKKTFLFSGSRISKNILQIEKAKVSKFKFMHTLSQSKSIFAIEQKAVVLCFIKYFGFLLGHPVQSVTSQICGVVVGPLEESLNFFSPLGFDVQTNSDHKTQIKTMLGMLGSGENIYVAGYS